MLTVLHICDNTLNVTSDGFILELGSDNTFTVTVAMSAAMHL